MASSSKSRTNNLDITEFIQIYWKIAVELQQTWRNTAWCWDQFEQSSFKLRWGRHPVNGNNTKQRDSWKRCEYNKFHCRRPLRCMDEITKRCTTI